MGLGRVKTEAVVIRSRGHTFLVGCKSGHGEPEAESD
jgi:hypothetical protein